jgi:pilus assembly protein Flp/PilA
VDLISFVKDVVTPWVRARVNAKSELGASLVEYALLVALIAVVCIVAIQFIGKGANKALSSTASALG